MALGADFDDVLAAARNGAEWAVAALYRDLQPALLRYLRTKERAYAEDIASDAWLALGPLLATFEGTEHELRRLLFSIAHRRLVDHWRAAARRGTVPVAPQDLAERRDADATEEAGIAALTTQEALDTIRRHLSTEQADVLLLRVVGGLGVDEVASIVGKRPGAVRALQHRAITRLATIFRAERVTR
jgi:RNA polymerase sigma-70 factor (ECF subfamily)